MSQQTPSTKALSRRAFAINAAAGALGATATAKAIAQAAPAPAAPAPVAPAPVAPAVKANSKARISLTFQSTWPETDFFNEAAKDFADNVNKISAGRIYIEMLPTAARVKTFEVLKAVSDGVIDGGHGVPGYWYDQQNALALWGEGPCFGMDSHGVMTWHNYGGGKELLAEIYDSLGMNVVSFLHGPIGVQPLGWFKKDIKSLADMRGLKYRTSGIARDLFAALDMETIVIPAASIVEALANDQIQGAEFANMTSDSTLGLHKAAPYCLTQSYHQPAQHFEALMNSKKFKELSAADKRVFDLAADATTQQFALKVIDRNSKDYQALKEFGTKFSRAPLEILKAQQKAWDKVVENKTKDNPLFAKVYESQRAYAQRLVRWQADFQLRPDLAYAHYFEAK